MENNKIRNLETAVLAGKKSVLKEVSFDYLNKNGVWESQIKEVFNRGDAATILLYNRGSGTVILTQQFRIATFMNGNEAGVLIEACAGMLDGDSPVDGIIRETEEETGYRIESVEKVFELFMSPGALTERVHFFVAPYDASMKKADGGGLAAEHEEIDILELDFDKALQMISSGEIKDAKTVILLQYLKLKGIM